MKWKSWRKSRPGAPEELDEVEELDEAEELDEVAAGAPEELEEVAAGTLEEREGDDPHDVESIEDEELEIYEELSLDNLEISHDDMEELPIAATIGQESAAEMDLINDKEYSLYKESDNMANKNDINGDLEPIDLEEFEELDELDDIEELDNSEELDDLEELFEDEIESALYLLTIDEAISSIESLKLKMSENREYRNPLSEEHNLKIDSLISVKSEGLLPDVHFEEDGFLFTESNKTVLPLSKNGLILMSLNGVMLIMKGELIRLLLIIPVG
jgi:hypothetical protein